VGRRGRGGGRGIIVKEVSAEKVKEWVKPPTEMGTKPGEREKVVLTPGEKEPPGSGTQN